jgi:hypothetical protein
MVRGMHRLSVFVSNQAMSMMMMRDCGRCFVDGGQQRDP